MGSKADWFWGKLVILRPARLPRGVDCAKCAPALQVALEVPQRGQEMPGD